MFDEQALRKSAGYVAAIMKSSEDIFTNGFRLSNVPSMMGQAQMLVNEDRSMPPSVQAEVLRVCEAVHHLDPDEHADVPILKKLVTNFASNFHQKGLTAFSKCVDFPKN